MRWPKRLVLILRSLFLRSRVEAELDEEMQFHLECQIRANIAAGLTASEAEKSAMRAFHGVEQQKELCRQMRRTLFLENFFRDINYAVRGLVHNPGFSTTVILTLALGIGANTAIFSLVDATMLRPLPYPEADRIVALSEVNRKGDELMASWPDFVDWRNETKSYSAIAAVGGSNFNLTGDGQAERLHGLRVSASFLSVLAIHPSLGRDFLDFDDKPGATPVAILSNALWQHRFGSNPHVIGRKIILDSRVYAVAGVLPATFRFLYARDVYVPIGLEADNQPNRGVRSVARVLARLKPRISIGKAASELSSIQKGLQRTYPQYDSGVENTLRPFSEMVAAPAKRGLLILSSAVGVLLLIACANVASLLLARAGSRQREMAIRRAVGAGRQRLICQLFTESGLLAAAGAVIGCLLAAFILPVLVQFVPTDQGEMEQYVRATVSLRVLSFTVCLTVFTTFLFGLVPAWSMSRSSPNYLYSGTRATSASFQRLSLRSLLVTTQIGFAVVLLVSAALLSQSLLRLWSTDIGFRLDHLLTARLKVPSNRYTDHIQRGVFYDHLIERIGSIPGVTQASGATCLPLTGKDCWPSVFHVEGRPTPRPEDISHAYFNAVLSGYLKTMQIPLIRGRDLNELDDSQHEKVALVNKRFADQFFPLSDPLGRRIQEGYGADQNGYRIVGVVGDTRRDSPDIAPVPEVFMAARQIGPDAVELVIRTHVKNPLVFSREMVRVTHSLDADVPLYDFRTMQWYFDYQTADRRFPTLLLSGFAGLALLLASIGLYGLIAYLVAQRTKEFGIRLALGAQKRDVAGMLMKQGMQLVITGLVAGLLGAWATSRVMSALLFAIQPNDTKTLLGISCLLLAVAALACWLPGRRAANLNPALTLRVDQ